MPKRGRPKDSGYRSQILLLWVLIAARNHEYSYTELVKTTGIHRNRVIPNVVILMTQGLLRRQQKGHSKLIVLNSVENAEDYVLQRFMKAGIKKIKVSPKETKSHTKNTSAIDDERIMKLKHQPVLEIAVFDSSSLPINSPNYSVDKELGIITFKHPPTETLKIEYRAGYRQTPADVEQACKNIVSGYLRWICAIMKDDSEMIRKIPKDTFENFEKLLSPYKKEYRDAIRDSVLSSLRGSTSEIIKLEEKDKLTIYENYTNLPMYVEEVRFIEKEKEKRTRRNDYNWKSLKGEGQPKRKK